MEGRAFQYFKRMMHAVRSRNLPFSVEDEKQITNGCQICARIKPKFYNPELGTLVKATQPFERLIVDFKGSLADKSWNKYLLTVVDEYSRFPFVFLCPDISATTVIRCLCSLFEMFGVPAYIHTDHGTVFTSAELRRFLLVQGVAVSQTTPFNTQGNVQREK